MVKGVGPHRAELLAKRGLRTFEDLLGYLPFRYEDRIRFAKIREIAPGAGLHPARAGLERQPRPRTRGRAAACITCSCATIPARCPANFFTATISRKHSSRARDWFFTGRRNSIRMRPGRIEMINPEIRIARRGRRGLDRSRPHRSHLRSHRRHQLAHDAAHRLPGARKIFRRAARPVCPRKFWRATNSLRGATRSTSCIFRRRRNRWRR